jgi:hypothetical protein
MTGAVDCAAAGAAMAASTTRAMIFLILATGMTFSLFDVLVRRAWAWPHNNDAPVSGFRLGKESRRMRSRAAPPGLKFGRSVLVELEPA